MEDDDIRLSQEQAPSYSLNDSSDKQSSYLECEGLWHRLKDVQTELENSTSSSNPTFDTCPGTLQSQNQTYQEYEKRLRAELVHLQEKNVEPFLPENKEMQYIILQQDQTRQKQQLKETLSYVKAKHSSLVDSIKQEEELNTTLKKVQDALKAKDIAVSQPDSGSSEDDSSADAALSDLRAKVTKVKQANKYFQSALKELFSMFPSPSDNGQRKKSSKSALDNTRDFDEDSFISVSSIIGQLIEQALNFPEQPYIDISERMWPQHIEFLLRSQIIVKNPENSARIKLIPFHL